MVSTTKALVSLSISSFVTFYRFCCYSGIESMSYISPLLIIYCIADINNKTSMIIHHIATIFINIMFMYVISNSERLLPYELKSVEIIILSFFNVEISTIFLSLIHLGYKNIYIKLSFFLSFVFFRIILLNYNFFTYYNMNTINKICNSSYVCYLSWYLGAYPLIFINWYWILLILQKTKKQNKIKKNK